MRSALIIEEEPEQANKLKHVLQLAFPNVTSKHISEPTDVYLACENTASQYHLAFIDILYQENQGEKMITLIKRKSPNTQIVVCTSFDDERHIQSALRAGVSGYLLKDMSEELFIKKLRGLMNGDPALSPSVTRSIMRHFYQQNVTHTDAINKSREQHLSRREKEVLLYIAKGFSKKEIARFLEVADCTIAGYTRDVYLKLNITSRAEAAIQACKLKLIDPEKFQ